MTGKELTARERRVYDALQDELSRDIFWSRNGFGAKWQPLYEQGFDAYNDPPQELAIDDSFWKYLEDEHNSIASLERRVIGKKVVIYGYAYSGRAIQKRLEYLGLGGNIVAVWDRNPQLLGVSVGSRVVEAPPQSGADVPDIDLIIVCSGSFAQEIHDFLLSLGIVDSKIFSPYWVNQSEEHFDAEIIVPRLVNDEIFIDGGVMNFDTSLNLLKLNYGVKKIYAFEPDPANFRLAAKAVAESGFANVDLRQAGWGSERAKLKWKSDGGGSHVDENSSLEVDVYAIDDIIPENEKVTFIKLDVEGLELEVLKGAARTIRQCKPKLAISIYHKPFDYYELPEYILSLVPEYKVYMRHPSSMPSGTDCYFVL
ncbi:MAG: FkbM family methyltransferase [Oscillospiraceae bacterium]|jgi:FkbM family methyltransferase|nr:FkbM family methyltransferase [Oscillospiraceae bacterium]